MQLIKDMDEAVDKGAFSLGKHISNIAWSKDEVGRLIHGHALFLHEIPAGRLWFSCSERRNQLFFQIDGTRMDTIQPSLLPVDACVSEIIFSSAQQPKKEAERAVLQRLGFIQSNTVMMMSFAQSEASDKEQTPVLFGNAEQKDMASIENMYDTCFDSLTDAIPDSRQLAEEIAAGNVKVIRSRENETEPIGSAMLRKSKGRTLIRHLCIAPNRRGEGLGSALMREITNRLLPGENCTLWVKQDNTTAVNIYLRIGFKPMDRKMEIWVRK